MTEKMSQFSSENEMFIQNLRATSSHSDIALALAADINANADFLFEATVDDSAGIKLVIEHKGEKHPRIIQLRNCLAQVKSDADPDIKRLTKQCADLCTKLTSTINTEIKQLEIEDRKLAELYTASFPKRQKIASKISDLRSLMPSN